MLSYIYRRVLYMLVTLVALSVVSFTIIQLPPGDYLTSYIVQLQSSGTQVAESQAAALRKNYGLDQPVYVQYLKWAWNMLHGNLGWSFQWNRPVVDLIGERVTLTVAISLLTLVFTYVAAITIGIFSALRQYSVGDYLVSVISFIGIATPNFILGLIVMFAFYKYFGISVGGLFSPEYVEAPWSWAKAMDMARHLWAPIIIIGLGGTAWNIRVMRGCLLDELRKPYVQTARAKGLSESRVIYKYPVRIALNPIASTVGWTLPGIFSGETIVAVVLSLPTVGPMFLHALLAQDMFLAASIVMILGTLTVFGTLISDIMLAWLDPRIRYQGQGAG